MSETAPSLVLGTAGHIDHGKSALVKALTGVDPDRLDAEKQRGITIELGFARLDLGDGLSVGVVDVPGHERFVRQMIAGASGIDLALLCIAADDGIMPQTREHLAVLELLGIGNCVVALTKADLVDEDWLKLVTNDVTECLATTPYQDAPIVAVSSVTGQGLDELKDVLADAVRKTTRRTRRGGIRLPVDRVFTIKGAGTVVTGTLWSGEAAAGEEVKILPGGKRSRIRSVQVHGEEVEAAQPGHRVALNLNQIGTDEISPGDFIAAPDAPQASDRFDAYLTYLGAPEWDRPLESGMRVHVAHGTREVIGRVLLMNRQKTLEKGQSAYAQIRLDEDLPIAWQDRFVIRSFSPVYVIGGGTVLRAHPRRTTNLTDADKALLDALREGDEAQVARAAFELSTLPVDASHLAVLSGLDEASARTELETLQKEGVAKPLPGSDYYTSASFIQKAGAQIEAALLDFHTAEPNESGITKEALRRRCFPQADATCFDALVAQAEADGKATVTSRGLISHPSASAATQQLEEEAADKLAGILGEAGLTPPMTEDLIKDSGLDSSLAYRALGQLEDEGRIQQIGQSFYIDREALTTLEEAVRTRLANGATASAAELKEAMQTSRKYAIPLLEYFDAKKITRREGDLRRLNS